MRTTRSAILAIFVLRIASAQNPPPAPTKAPIQDPNSAAVAQNNEAVRLSHEGKEREAEEFYRAAIAASHDDLVRAKIANNLATLYQRQDRYHDAEAMFRCALELRQKNLLASSVEVAYSLNNLAEVYRVEGRDWEARNLMETAVRNLQPFHPDDPGLPIILTNLAVVLGRFQQFDQAEELLRSALIAYDKQREADSRGYGIMLDNLGQILQTKNDLESAEPLYKQAIGIFEHMGDPGRTDLAATLANAGKLYERLDRIQEAKQTEERALKLLHPSGDALLRAQILRNLGNIVATDGHPVDALPYFEQSLAIQEKTLGDQHPNTAGVLLDYSSATLRAGNKSLARKLRKRAMDLLARVASNSPAQLTVSLRDLQDANYR